MKSPWSSLRRPKKKKSDTGKGPATIVSKTAPVASPVVTIQGEIVDQYRVPADADPDESVEVIIADINSFGR